MSQADQQAREKADLKTDLLRKIDVSPTENRYDPDQAKLNENLKGMLQQCFDQEIRDIATIVPWDLQHAPEETAKIQIGLSPAFDDSLARYKQPVKIIQYMAVGAVVIAAPIGMTPHMIIEGEKGYLAKDDNEWLDHLHELIQNPDRLAQMSQTARAYAVEQFSYPAYIKRWHALLEDVLSK